MEQLTVLELLEAAKYISKEIEIIERGIREQTAAMQGLSSLRISDMPRNRKLPEGMDRVLANKDELERKQRETVAMLYAQLSEAEGILQKERNPDMRIIMRMVFVENQPLKRAAKTLNMSMSSIMRLKGKVKDKYQ